MVKVNVYTFGKEVPTFLKRLEEPVGVTDAFSFEREAVTCEGIVENLDEYYTVVVRANYEKGTLLLEYIVRDEQDIVVLKE